MKIIPRSDRYNEKVNFIDKNNRFVGFCLWSNCCEYYGWKIESEDGTILMDSKKVELKEDPISTFDDYCFDLEFLEMAPNKLRDDEEKGMWDDRGASAKFRLKLPSNKKGPDIYLLIYNWHNGYYCHGFEFDIGGMQGRGVL